MALFGSRSRRGGKPRIVALGDSALLAEFSTEVDLEVNARIQRVAAAIRARRLPWIRDVVPAIGALAVHFDPVAVARLDPKAPDARLGKVREEVRALIESCLGASRDKDADAAELVELPVCYEGELAPDLDAVAERTGLTPEEVIRRHAASDHRVLMVGFAPGHPYIGGLDPKLSVPRRATPRTRVPEGSIAIANAQSVVYPFTISGGWSLIGRTPVRVFDPDRSPPALFSPGQRVRFTPVSRAEFNRLRKQEETAA
jgi:KipI family sensor histidine kinase inhibitor